MADKIKAKLLGKLAGLQKKEEDLLALLESVDVSLYDMGYHIEKETNSKSGKVMPQTGIRIGGKLSFRGKEKSAEYFKLVDTDNDGYVNFEDLRAMKSFTSPNGIVHEAQYSNWENWKLFLTDNDIQVTPRGELDETNFIKYREIIENVQPLSTELQYLKLGYLPEKLKDWARFKALWREVLALREYKKSPLQKTQESDDTMAFEDLSFILCNSGLTYSKPEIAGMMYQRVKKQFVMSDLIRKYSKLNLSQPGYDFLLDSRGALVVGSVEKLSKVVVEDILKVDHRQFVPWVMSNYVNIDQKELYRGLLGIKYYLFRGMRYVDQLARHAFNFAAHMNDRLVFRDFVPVLKHSVWLKEISMMKFGLLIGEETAREGGISGTFKLVKTEQPEQVLKKYRLPSDAGSTLIIDFLYHLDVTEDSQRRCIELLRGFIMHHFEKELRNNSQFNGMYVLNDVSDGDSSKILRIAFSYKRIVSLDGYLEHMLLPYKLIDLFSVIVGEFRTNIDISDWVKNRVVNVDETMAASVDFSVGLKRNLIVQILERVSLAMSAGVTKAQSALLDSDEHRTTPATDEEEESKRRLYRWKHLAPYFPWVKKWSTFLSRVLKCMKTCTMRFKYSSIGEFLHKWGVNDFLFHQSHPLHTVYRVAYVKECYDWFCTKYVSEFGAMHEKLKKYLELKKLKDDTKRRHELMGTLNTFESVSVEKDKERQQTLEKMRRLGVIDTGSDTNIFEEEFAHPGHYVDSLRDEQYKQDVQGMLTLEHIQKSIIGLQTVELFTGRSRFTLSVQGLDVFELLPALPSMQQVRDKNVIRPKTPKRT